MSDWRSQVSSVEWRYKRVELVGRPAWRIQANCASYWEDIGEIDLDEAPGRESTTIGESIAREIVETHNNIVLPHRRRMEQVRAMRGDKTIGRMLADGEI